ncbi:MAG: GTPase ObgE [Acidobacteria bacterium]|nr:GTPase ObgE [Acidobacteriota bacterium]MBI3657142.1 GTPase ObgE [Acidobacteriota bacterium]
MKAPTTTFIDEAIIYARAGHGGDGCIAFRREKYVPRGGPSGGDGGRGGHIIMESTCQLNTLLNFRYKPRFVASRGGHGEGSNCHGRDGEDLVVQVPLGTLAYDAGTSELLHDFATAGDRFVVARGGRGGFGNAHYVSATNQVPRQAEPGRLGKEHTLRLELRLLADVGLVGLPNVGKSTLISRISAAKPKIADYPFTTLSPNLGVVSVDDRSFVVADIPGLIEGAHAGHGLGDQFLRHIERTKVIAHLVDLSQDSVYDPIEAYNVVNKELELYDPGLLERRQIIVATKLDALQDQTKLKALIEWGRGKRIEIVAISAVTGEGIPRLIRVLRQELGL